MRRNYISSARPRQSLNGLEHNQMTKTVVTIHQLYVVRQHKNGAPEVCPDCNEEVASLLAPDEAAIITGISTRTIYRWVEAGSIHFRQTAGDSILVCLNSFPITADPDQSTEP